MTRASSNDLDYLATRLHSRRSRMAEADRLDALCQIRSLPELSRAIQLDSDCSSAVDFQRRVVRDLVWELAGFVKHVGEAGGDLFAWLLVRFQIENVKVLVRGLANQISPDELRAHLVPLPEGIELDVEKLLRAGTLEEICALLPAGKPRECFGEALAIQHEAPRLFLIETALDGGYLQTLLAKARRLSGEDVAIVRPLVLQEVNFFKFMLVVRGRFHFGLTPDSLLAMPLPAILDDWFRSLLTAPDGLAAAKASVGIVLDELPAERDATGNPFDAADFEALAWKRFQRLANAAFRRGHMGLGAVIGYAGLRRLEVANLITLSEGIRIGMAPGEIRARLIPRTNMDMAEVVHV